MIEDLMNIIQSTEMGGLLARNFRTQYVYTRRKRIEVAN
jgi:hypothetical protein